LPMTTALAALVLVCSAAWAQPPKVIRCEELNRHPDQQHADSTIVECRGERKSFGEVQRMQRQQAQALQARLRASDARAQTKLKSLQAEMATKRTARLAEQRAKMQAELAKRRSRPPRNG